MRKNEICLEAQRRINKGEHPSGLVHLLYYPIGYDDESPYQGISTALPAGADLSGYTSTYYTLSEVAKGLFQ